MLYFQDINLGGHLSHHHPLHVGKIYGSLKSMPWDTRKKRQSLILSVAEAWFRLVRKKDVRFLAFVEEEMWLTYVASKSPDYKKAVEFFFNIKKVGYRVGGKSVPTVIIPKKLPALTYYAVKHLFHATIVAKFVPLPEPTDPTLRKSSVHIDLTARDEAIKILRAKEREDLIPKLEWLFDQGPVSTFYFKLSGTLQKRETSVWPITSLETWPREARKLIMKNCIDLESAYCQFLLSIICGRKRKDELLSQAFSRLSRLLHNKTEYRLQLCQLAGVEPSHENIKTIKTAIMALANGSRLTLGLMESNSPYSEVVKIVRAAWPDMPLENLINFTDELIRIKKEFAAAQRLVSVRGGNRKSIFISYFEWERHARNQLWEIVGETGIMVHDAIEGIATNLTEEELTDQIVEKTKLMVSVNL